MTQLAAGALIFERADVRPAVRTVGRSYSAHQVRESLRLGWSESPYFTPGFPLALPLVHATRIDSLNGPPTARLELAAGEPIVSDTGELAWSGAAARQGLVSIDTARSQALVGFCKANPKTTKNLAVRADTPFCAITLGALDREPIARSGRLLLTATARVANSGMVWDSRRKTPEKWGTPPSCIEPVTGTVSLRALEGATTVAATPLDATGRPLGPAVPAVRTAEGWDVPLGSPPTTWYFVSVTR